MRVAKFAKEVKNETIANLPLSTIYKLAAPNLPRGVKSNILLALEANPHIGVKKINDQLRAADLQLSFHPAAVRVSVFCTTRGAGWPGMGASRKRRSGRGDDICTGNYW